MLETDRGLVDYHGCIAPEHFADARTGLAPGSAVRILTGAGHFTHLDQPDEVAGLVLDWIDRPNR